MCLLLSSGSGPALYAAQLRWVGPQALGNGSGIDSDNRAAFSLGLVNGWLADSSLTDLKIYFVAGTYTVSPAPAAQHLTGLTLRGGLDRSVALIGISSLGVKPRLVLGSIQGNTLFSPNWTKSILHHWLIVSGTEAGKSSYLKRLVIENLELDGNFPNQGAWASEGNATGYKSFAIDVAAESGWIRNVVVRNFGSVGDVPASHIHSGPGVEAFPVRFRSFAVSNQAVIGAAPNNFPWIVEDLELTDFHSIHGGYGTMIMPVVYQEPPRATVTDTPVAVIRRCQIRTAEGAIAFGTAGADKSPFPNVANLTGVISGRIFFQDNVVTGAGAGFNTDTDSIGPLVFDNNAFLDVGFLGFLGLPDSGIHHDGYLITNNLIRLRGRFNQKIWTDITLTNYPNHASDPNLPLGRFIPDDIFSGGLVVQGAAGRVYLGNNDFTTWPSNNFYLANPSDTSKAKFWIVWKMPEFQNINSWLYSRERRPVEPMRLNDTRLSGVSYDFKSFTTLDSGEVAQFRVNSPESTAVQHMDYRNALSGLPDSFVPRGRLRRVLPQMTGGSPSRLGAVREVQIGEVTYSGGTLTVPCRIVGHRLRASGESSIETQAVGGQTLRLRCIRRDAAWIESTNDFTGPTSHPSTGVVTFTIPNLSNVSGLCRLTVWIDAGSGGIGTLEPDQDGWATFEYPLQTTANLPVVDLTASPDVGDDKNTASAKRATLQVTRSFATTSALTVNLTLPTGLYLRPGTSSDLTATYGFSGTADYNITGSSWTCASPYTTATLTIPANQTTATAQVVTRADQLTEQNLIVCRLAPATTYTPGASTNVNILIFDGPYWTVQELAGPPGPPLNSSAGMAVNAGVLNATGTWGTPPQVVGSGTWHNLSGQPETHGALWLPSTTAQSNPTTDFGLTFRPYGISFRASTAPADRAKVVGSWGNSAYQILDNNSGGTTLLHFSGFTGPSLAWAISPDGTRTVGYSTSFGRRRTAMWVGTGTPVDLSSSIEDPMNERIGEAKAVNNAGVIVGYTSGFPGNFSLQRPFSNDGNWSLLSDDDYLTIPSGWPSANGSGVVNGVATGPNSLNYAVGRFFLENSRPRVAVRWNPDQVGIPSIPEFLNTLVRGEVSDLESEAFSISFTNSGLMIVGWSGASPTHSGRKAVFFSNGVVKDFNDRHFIHGPGWSLQAAHSVTANGVIAGVGEVFGLPRGFVLMPRTAGQ